MQKSLQPVFIRESLVKSIRQFFEQQKFHEVIVPVFSKGLPVEPNIYSFSSEWHTNQGIKSFYLSVSPENGLKKMLAKGIGNCFAIGKCFRNLESSGIKHNPEFLMLEWYRENAEYEQIMNDLRELILLTKRNVDVLLGREISSNLHYLGKEISLEQEWQVLSLEQLLREHSGIEISEVLTDEEMQNVAQKKGYSTEGATWDQLFDQIVLNEVEPHFPDSPFFLVDFPAKISPLCKVQKEKKYLADRFEFFLFGIEIANGNNENTDAEKITKVFAAEQEKRTTQNLSTHPVDEEFIQALEVMNAKKYAGIGVGIDRLAMILANAENISEVEVLL